MSNLTEELRQERNMALAELGETIYDGLKEELEADHNGEYVAIHLDSGDFAIGRNGTAARKLLLTRHAPDGRTHTRRIGNDPDYGLLSRILPGELAAGRVK